MSKLYFLVPESSLAEQIACDLKRHGALENDIGVLGSSDSLMRRLPEPDPTEGPDPEHAVEHGAGIGASTGLLAGLPAASVPGGFAMGGAAIPGVPLGADAFGAWASSLIGVSLSSQETRAFESAIRHGALLMIVNTERVSRERARRIVSARYPDMTVGGEAETSGPW
jgi:hypothetical protein